MKLRKAIPIGVLLAVLAVCGIIGLRSQSLPRLGFVATTRMEEFDHKTGKLRSVKTILHAYRSDGANSRLFEFESGLEYIDPNTRLVTLVDFVAKTYTTQPLAAQAVARRKAPLAASCPVALSVPSCSDGPTILGYVTREAKVAPAGAPFGHRRLASPQLSWFPLVWEAYSDSGTLIQRTVATSVEIGEPSSEFFSVPPGFQEVDAATHMQRGIEARGQSISPKALEEVRKRDREKRANIMATYGLIGELKLGWMRLVSALNG